MTSTTQDTRLPMTEDAVRHESLSLRDWFAGMVLQGLLTSYDERTMTEYYAKISYKIADAMLKEREK